MKLREILTEEPGVTPAGFKIPKNTSANAEPSTTAKSTARDPSSVGKDTASTGAIAAGAAAAGAVTGVGAAAVKGAPTVAKGMAYALTDETTTFLQKVKDPKKIVDFLKANARANKSIKIKGEALYKSKFSTVARGALLTLQLSTSLISLAETRLAISEAEKAGVLDPNIAENSRTAALRQFQLEVVSVIAASALSIAFARTIFFLFRVFAVGVSGPAIIPGITALIASEVAINALVAFIKTDTGAKFFADYLAGILIDDDSLVQQAIAAMKRAVGMNVDSTSRKKVGQEPAPAQLPPGATPENPTGADIEYAKKIGLRV